MKNIYKALIFFLITGASSCVSDYTNINATNDEDKDIGLGGTGLLANTNSGLGGTGVIGEITGFGSIFINGIEIEYDNNTPFTIDGNKAAPQQLRIGDVVEVLTTDAKSHTQAQIINLRHEVIGRVESVNQHTFSYVVQGQTIIQRSGKDDLPKTGETVAVSGIRIDEKTIMSTRVMPADSTKTLLKTHTDLPFIQQAARWSIQTHIDNGQVRILLNGDPLLVAADKKLTDSLKGVSAIRILELHKSEAGSLKLDKVISPLDIPRGQASPLHKLNQNNKMQRPINIQPNMSNQPRTMRNIR